MMKTALLLFSAVVCGCSGMEPLRGTVMPEYLNIRPGAGLGYRIIGRLRNGDTVRILSSPKEEWCRISMPENASDWNAASQHTQAGNPQEGEIL